ncbi:MAG: oligosaccharide flippase family protein [Symploca sp. SIO1B1]|nr:oligosaccharide flippase family protein [Symploca sp. SIO2D2]NER47019.1 oligosaccharide flippase family protein [Symploca sp. SIO1A3]NER95180.1 oligosaccharide flippase family protein [Symploca sp. SIO1B1]
MSSIKKKAIIASLWTIAGFGAGQVLRFGSNLILTRLLVPELFGVMTLVNIFIIGLQLFSDTGVGPSIIQNKRGNEPIFLNTAWTLQVIRGFVLWFASLLLAWPVAQFYDKPQFLWLVPVAGLTTIITGFESTSRFTLNRNLALREIAIFELGSQACAIVVMIVWAWFSPTIWALVGGNIVSGLIKALWSHWLIPGYSNRFAWDKEVAQELFSFGRWIFISTALTFLADQSDRLTLGKLFSDELLGVYSIAFNLAQLPRAVIGAVSGKVIFPAFAKAADLPRAELRAKILKNRKLILFPTAFGLAILVSFGDILISTLYDERYAQAAWMMPILALGIWPILLTKTIDGALLAVGKSQYLAFSFFFKFIFVIVGVPLGFHWQQELGAITVVALNDLPLYAVISYGLWREGLNSLVQDILATLALLAFITIMVMGRNLLGFGLPIEMIL